MLAGARAFEGDDVTEILGAIVKTSARLVAATGFDPPRDPHANHAVLGEGPHATPATYRRRAAGDRHRDRRRIRRASTVCRPRSRQVDVGGRLRSSGRRVGRGGRVPGVFTGRSMGRLSPAQSVHENQHRRWFAATHWYRADGVTRAGMGRRRVAGVWSGQWRTVCDPGEQSHRFPTLIKGTDVVLYRSLFTEPGSNRLRTRIMAFHRRTGVRKAIVDPGEGAEYMDSGHLVWVADGRAGVVARRVPHRLQGGRRTAASEAVGQLRWVEQSQRESAACAASACSWAW